MPGRISLRGNRVLNDMQRFNDTHEPQYIPGQNRAVTFVSRLQSVQAAVDQQLRTMAKTHPNRRLALIAFNHEVSAVHSTKQASQLLSLNLKWK